MGHGGGTPTTTRLNWHDPGVQSVRNVGGVTQEAVRPWPDPLDATGGPVAAGHYFGAIEEKWIEIRARILTTHRVEKYGGIRFGREALERAAEQINSDGSAMSLMVDHDASRPVRQRNQRASVVELDDGEYALEMTAEVVDSDWREAEGMQGMSVAHHEPLGSVDGPFPTNEHIELSAEASVWTADQIALACEHMSVVAPVDGFELMQFARHANRRVIVRLPRELVVQTTAGLLVVAISNGVGALVGSGDNHASTTRIELVMETADGRLTAILDTSDKRVVHQAITELSNSVGGSEEGAHSGLLLWDAELGRWVDPNVGEGHYPEGKHADKR